MKPGRQWKEVNARLSLTPGIVETGLFVGNIEKAYFGMEDGKVMELSAPKDQVGLGPLKKAKINGDVVNGV